MSAATGAAFAWSADPAQEQPGDGAYDDLTDGAYGAIRVVEVAVEGTDGEVYVRREPEGHVEVQWFCGDKREFTDEQLHTAIGGLDALGDHPGIWMKADALGGSIAVMIEDGMLYAATSPRGWGPGEAEEHDNAVPWGALRMALLDA